MRRRPATAAQPLPRLRRRTRPGAHRLAGLAVGARVPALGLHAAGRSNSAVGELLALVADVVRTPDVLRFKAALHGNAGYLLGLDGQRPAG